MKRTVPFDSGRAESATSAKARVRPEPDVSGHKDGLAGLARMMNESLMAPAQLLDSLQHSSRVRSLMDLSDSINQVLPAQFENDGDGAEQESTAAPSLAPSPSGESVAQAFGIHDRQWAQATTVTHLGATAYRVAAADGSSVVIKRSGSGKIAYELGAEGPTPETVASRVGEIPELGVDTAHTVMIETAGEEGQRILARLRSLDGLGPGLADLLAPTESFLVMDFARGTTVAKSGLAVAQADNSRRAQWFYGLGRLWVFDVMIHNTDRFLAANWGNVVFGENGRVYGIDQMIGFAASNLGVETASSGEYAMKQLATAIDLGRRREFSKSIFESLSGAMGMPFASMETMFIINFESGMLDGVMQAAGVPLDSLKTRLAEMPGFAAEASASLGLGGAQVILSVFQDVLPKATEAYQEFHQDIGRRGLQSGAISKELAPLEGLRGSILSYLDHAAGDLLGYWQENSTMWLESRRKSAWQERQGELNALAGYMRKEFFGMHAKISSAIEHHHYADLLFAQMGLWADTLAEIWSQFRRLLDGIGETAEIKVRLVELRKVIAREQARKRIPEQF